MFRVQYGVINKHAPLIIFSQIFAHVATSFVFAHFFAASQPHMRGMGSKYMPENAINTIRSVNNVEHKFAIQLGRLIASIPKCVCARSDTHNIVKAFQ